MLHIVEIYAVNQVNKAMQYYKKLKITNYCPKNTIKVRFIKMAYV